MLMCTARAAAFLVVLALLTSAATAAPTQPPAPAVAAAPVKRAATAAAAAPASTGAALTVALRTYNPAFPASSPDLAPADAAWTAASSSAERASGGGAAAATAAKTAVPAAVAPTAPAGRWPPGTSPAVKAALPIGADGTVAPLPEPKVTATVVPPRGSIYYSGGTISMRDVPGRAVATGGNSTADDPVPAAAATVQPSASIG